MNETDESKNKNLPSGLAMGDGEGESPLIRRNEDEDKIDVRTLSSDKESIKETGGDAPRPYTPEIQPMTPPAEIKEEPTISIPESFGTETGEVRTEKQDVPYEPQNKEEQRTQKTPSSKKGIFFAIVAVVVVSGLALGYFFVYPLFFPSEQPKEQEAEALPPPAAESPPVEIPVVPIEPVIPEPEPEPIPPEPEPVPEPKQHSSLFQTPADELREIPLAGLTLADVKNAIQENSPASNALYEIVFRNPQNELVGSRQVLPLFAPNVFTPNVVENFTDDFSMFIVRNSEGVWFGFAAKLQDGIPPDSMKNQISALEDSSVSSFFLENPGAPNVWKDGQVNGAPARYIAYSNAGAAFSYVWLENYLLVSTNYAAAQEAARRLGF